MDTDKYALFAKTAELKNLTLAAEELGYTQSAASHIISVLEAELGFSLFTRSRAGMTITPDGQALLPAVYNLLHCNEQILQTAKSIRGLESGSIRVASFSTVTLSWLSQIIGSFHAAYSGIHIDVFDGSYEKIRQWILDGRVDCGLLTDTRTEDMPFIPLQRDTLYAVLPQGHHLCANDVISPRLLMDELFITPSEGTTRDIQYLIGGFSVKPNFYFNTISDISALALVRNGLGVSVLPGILLHTFQLENIAVRPLEGCRSHVIGIATQHKRYISPAVKCFFTYVKQWFAVNLPGAAD